MGPIQGLVALERPSSKSCKRFSNSCVSINFRAGRQEAEPARSRSPSSEFFRSRTAPKLIETHEFEKRLQDLEEGRFKRDEPLDRPHESSEALTDGHDERDCQANQET